MNTVLPPRAYPVGGLTITLSALWVANRCGMSRDDVGLGTAAVPAGLRTGGVAAAVVSGAQLCALALPRLRDAYDDDRVAVAGIGELLWTAAVRIPVGTVLTEEVVFRGVLPGLLATMPGPRWRPAVVSAGLFGLWHVLPALRLAGDNPALASLVGRGRLPTVVAGVSGTFLVGLALHALRVRGRGVLAPILVHLATNSGCYLISWLVRRRRTRPEGLPPT
ncbi:CAAX protease self-immunity [Actinoalloteichus hymeniacidonis]|uniref:CAAX protease self-immunity n=2 Tax=Actinoalloteichus hymeniacidonis TaxID=340345 RepID=A0AAC9MYA3_9PSEU|nr:CAAX protease self-immunity [Actinoalloteichus hymeniacidonis]